MINKLENLELLKTTTPPSSSSIQIELSNEPRPAYEIFGNLEHLILFSDEDDDFYMPVVDGKQMFLGLNEGLRNFKVFFFSRYFTSRNRVPIGPVLH